MITFKNGDTYGGIKQRPTTKGTMYMLRKGVFMPNETSTDTMDVTVPLCMCRLVQGRVISRQQVQVDKPACWSRGRMDGRSLLAPLRMDLSTKAF